MYLANNSLNSFSISDFFKISVDQSHPLLFFSPLFPSQDILVLIVVPLTLQQFERINQKFPKICFKMTQQEQRCQNTKKLINPSEAVNRN